MKRISLDRGWKFTSNKNSLARIVDLPHDFTIETDVSPDALSASASGFYEGGRGVYEKEISIPQEWENKKIIVEFDGSYGLTTVFYNDRKIAFHPYGYTPFHVDISDFITEKQNGSLRVDVDNSSQPNSRWYSGSGLYRSADILVSERIHISPWGIYAHTDRIDNGAAYITVEVTAHNETEKSGEFRVFAEAEGNKSSSVFHIDAGKKTLCRLHLIIPNAKLWSVEAPSLYEINAKIEDLNGNILDCDSISFGIRTVSADTKNGFMLNGKTVKLKGACIHHDNGILGAASYYDSEYRKLSLLKKNGFNAIRSAHNPPSRHLLDICDKLGIIVVDEAFDMWNIRKNNYDYHLYFRDFWESDMESFVLRDRNHPSVCIWSIGNEVSERGGAGNGYSVAATLAEKFRSLDPTRPVTSAICILWGGTVPEEDEYIFEKKQEIEKENGSASAKEYEDYCWGKYTEPFASVLDITGYNYQSDRYESDGHRFSGRVICGTESFPARIAEIWDKVEKLPYVIGDFTWTGYDYLGEAGIGKAVYYDSSKGESPQMTSPYPWRVANDSDFDICGFDRPQLHFRKAVWGSTETYIAVGYPQNYGKDVSISDWGWNACENRWTWRGYEGKPVHADVYSSAKEVELILNGKSLGRKGAGKENGFIAGFDLVYEPGTLTAISYNDNTEVSRNEITTADSPASLRLSSNVASLSSDGHSLAFVTAEIVDCNGKRVPDAEFLCTASVKGAGTLAAFGNARPVTEENYCSGSFTAYQGSVLAVIRSGWQKGSVTLTVSAKGLCEKTITLPVI